MLLILTAAYSANAQVGINKDYPDACSVLQVQDDRRGVLLPSMVDGYKGMKKNADSTYTNGLLYYERSMNLYFFYKKDHWEPLTPVPIGTVSMWYGNVASSFASGVGIGAMEGWLLCNGQNGTPNLTNMFIRGGSPVNNQASNKGGNNNPSVTLTVENMPTHKHTITVNGGGDHSHTISVTNAGAHTHVYSMTPDGTGYDSGSERGIGWEKDANTSSSGVHSHSASASNSGTHDHAASSANAGSGTAFNVPTVPEYYTMAFIMLARPYIGHPYVAPQ